MDLVRAQALLAEKYVAINDLIDGLKGLHALSQSFTNTEFDAAVFRNPKHAIMIRAEDNVSRPLPDLATLLSSISKALKVLGTEITELTEIRHNLISRLEHAFRGYTIHGSSLYPPRETHDYAKLRSIYFCLFQIAAGNALGVALRRQEEGVSVSELTEAMGIRSERVVRDVMYVWAEDLLRSLGNSVFRKNATATANLVDVFLVDFDLAAEALKDHYRDWFDQIVPKVFTYRTKEMGKFYYSDLSMSRSDWVRRGMRGRLAFLRYLGRKPKKAQQYKFSDPIFYFMTRIADCHFQLVLDWALTTLDDAQLAAVEKVFADQITNTSRERPFLELVRDHLSKHPAFASDRKAA